MTKSNRSGGPRTAQGIARVAQNSVSHGIFAATPVLPGIETEDEWQRHRAALITSLAPTGAMEEAFAERIALLWWRLARVARYEKETLVACQGWGSPGSSIVPERRYGGETVLRYESHIERALYRAIHQMERMQASRRGEVVAPPTIAELAVVPG